MFRVVLFNTVKLINRLVFVMAVQYVFCEVETEFLKHYLDAVSALWAADYYIMAFQKLGYSQYNMNIIASKLLIIILRKSDVILCRH